MSQSSVSFVLSDCTIVSSYSGGQLLLTLIRNIMSFSFLHNIYYSRRYAEDVTSVTSGASQGPHSFNLVFVCVFVSRLELSRICPVPYHQTQLATYSRQQYSNRAFKRNIIT